MNLLILPSWYETKENPTKGNFFKEQAEYIAEYLRNNIENSKVTILALYTFSLKNIVKYFKTKKYEESDINNIKTIKIKQLYIPKAERINIMLCGIKYKKAIKRLEKQSGKIDIIHIHSALNAGIWYNETKLKIPYVITEHFTLFQKGQLTQLQNKKCYEVFSKAALTIAVGKGLKNSIQKYTKKPVKIIFNVLYEYDASKIYPLKKEGFTFLSIGYNIFNKGFDILVEAFGEYLKRGEKGYLIIAGLPKGSDLSPLTKIVQKYHMEENVHFIPELSHNEVYAYLNMCDCFAMPSRYETFGVVFAEAMYMGKPVIASITGGPDSFVTEKTGILVPVNNTEEVVNALIKMRHNYSEYNSDYIKQFAIKTFSKATICKQIFDEYVLILSKSKQGNFN